MDKENIELAEEHIKLAEDLIIGEAEKEEGKTREKLKDAAFSLEKAEAEIKES